MPTLPENSMARVLRPLTLFDEGEAYAIAAGTLCSIADVLAGGRAYIVEFLIAPGVYDGDALVTPPVEIDTIVEANDLEAAE